jgi:hypothetical protein
MINDLSVQYTFLQGAEAMKKLLSLVCFVILCFTLTSCASNIGKTTNAVISFGKSSKFSKAELQSAVDCVTSKFKDFNGCTLTKLWYDEKKSNHMAKEYMTIGKGSVNKIKKGNVLVLLSNFNVDSTGAKNGFNPNSKYTGWNWILIRNKNKGAWRVEDWGY